MSSRSVPTCQRGKLDDRRPSLADSSGVISTELPIWRALASENMRKRVFAQSETSTSSPHLGLRTEVNLRTGRQNVGYRQPSAIVPSENGNYVPFRSGTLSATCVPLGGR